MKITIEVNKDKKILVTPSEDLTFGDIVSMYLNALRTSMEMVVEGIIAQENNKESEEDLRAQIHDFVAVNISALLNEFDPNAKDYKRVEK